MGGEPTSARTPGSRRVVLIGCGCLTFAWAVVAVLVAFNWAPISRTYRRTSAAWSELRTVQAALQKEYGTDQVAVQWRQYQGAPELTLVIRLVNPPILKDLPEDQEEIRARALARFARDHLRQPASVRAIEVTLARQAGFGVTFATNKVFLFTAEQLANPPSAK